MPRLIATLVSTIRGAEWWEYKLAPALASFYGTALLLGTSFSELWPQCLLLLLCLLPGAIYVSVLNDLTDVDEDAAAGKVNRMAGLSAPARLAALGLPLTLGAIFLWAWRDTPLLLGCYAAAWITFTFYSAPPVRLKARGFAGVLADAGGAHMFPALVAALLAFDGAKALPDLSWLMLVALWSLAYGMRGILWHQLVDREHDLATGVRTFAARHGSEIASRWGAWIVLPVETAALLCLLLWLSEPLPAFALVFYVALLWARWRRWGTRAVAVEPRDSYTLVLHEYHFVLLPISLLLALTLQENSYGFLLIAHLLLFPRGVWKIMQDCLAVLRPRSQQQIAAKPHEL